MKSHSLVHLLTAVCCTLLLTACNKKETAPESTVLTSPADTAMAGLFGRLHFFGAVKKPGNAPGSATSSALKKSFRDTLYLVRGGTIPIEFLHPAGTPNVAGIYVSYREGTFYLQVPELEETDKSDTVSTILVDVGGPGISLPLSFDIVVTPYGGNGQPIDRITVPVKIAELNDDPAKPGGCGPVLPVGDYWDWRMSFIRDLTQADNLSFYNSPNVVHGAGGQLIKGCCRNGQSFYNGLCAADTAAQRPLHFATFFQFPEESIRFSNNGTYDRTAMQVNANPDPPASNFCGNGEGVVELKSTIGLSVGRWTVRRITVPASLTFYYASRNQLTLQTTFSSGGGIGNPGGIIHDLDCQWLMLIEPDREGGNRNLFKVYMRKGPNDPEWFLMT